MDPQTVVPRLPRAILDTNVLVSQFISTEGAILDIRIAWAKHEFLALVPDVVIDELAIVLRRGRIRDRYRIPEVDIESFFRTLSEDAETIVRPYQRAGILPDLNDDLILESCRAANADYLVTGDRLVLSLERYFNTRIVSPAEFVAILRAAE